jgi:CBS domain-containing protein
MAPSAHLATRTVEEVMHAGIIDCPPQAAVRDVARSMAEHRVHCVVVDGLARGPRGAERLVWGLVSDVDLMRAIAAGTLDLPAAELAATEIVTIAADEQLERAAQIMSERDCSHLVVVDPTSSRPVGVVSSLDVARAVSVAR